MSEMMPENRRNHGRLSRLWWAVKTPGRISRFNRWRKGPAVVTKGYLAFRDIVVLGFVAAIVIAGVTTVSSLRAEDCRSANDRRKDAAQIANADVASDRKIWVAIDSLLTDGIPEPAQTVIFDELAAREVFIASTYIEQKCPQ